MQAGNSQITEQDQQRFNRQLQDPNDEIGVHSDEDEDSDEDEYDKFLNLYSIILKFIYLLFSDDESEDDEVMDPSVPHRGNNLSISFILAVISFNTIFL